VASQAAIRYVNVKPGQNWETIRLTQNVAAVSAQGPLPFGLPAGNISMAAGAEYRTEKGVTEVDAGAASRSYSFANFSPFSGKYNVKEGFVEFDAPLLEDSIVESLGLNAAARLTDYSTSGTVKTWKLGLTSQVNNLIRLRGTLSRDIRAPNLAELFNPGTPVQSSANDPFTGNNVPIFSTTSGNINLKPEKADTISAGVILSPASRLNLSLDFYSISLKGAVGTVSQAVLLERCGASGDKNSLYCSLLAFNGAGGQLSEIRNVPINLASQKVSGLDAQIDHQMGLGAGSLSSRLVGNLILTQTRIENGVTTNYRGAIGGDSPAQGIPRLRATITETYTNGPLAATVQGRFIGEAQLVNGWTPKDVDNNDIPAIFYVDVRGSYDLNDRIQVYGAVDNLFNQDPPNVAVSYNNSASKYSTAIRGAIYDQLGRAYRIGVRFKI